MRRSDWDGLMAAGRKPARAHAQSFKASVVALEAISDAYTSIGGCFTSATGQSLPNCAIRNMSARHPIADMRADIARRRFGPKADLGHAGSCRETAAAKRRLQFLRLSGGRHIS
jgi:hypothetical protein